MHCEKKSLSVVLLCENTSGCCMLLNPGKFLSLEGRDLFTV